MKTLKGRIQCTLTAPLARLRLCAVCQLECSEKVLHACKIGYV